MQPVSPMSSIRDWYGAGLLWQNRVRVVTRELGAQGTVCAGGRYDGLVEQLGATH